MLCHWQNRRSGYVSVAARRRELRGMWLRESKEWKVVRRVVGRLLGGG